jgi:hypothetical protein
VDLEALDPTPDIHALFVHYKCVVVHKRGAVAVAGMWCLFTQCAAAATAHWA